jgi:hypothetical protein
MCESSEQLKFLDCFSGGSYRTGSEYRLRPPIRPNPIPRSAAQAFALQHTGINTYKGSCFTIKVRREEYLEGQRAI